MTNAEALKKLEAEDIAALLKHYEIKIGSKASRQQKENAILKFAEEKEMDLTDLISEEPEVGTGGGAVSDSTVQDGEKESDTDTTSTAPETPEPTPTEEKKPFVLPSQKKTAVQPEIKDQGMVEVKFKVNTKYGGVVYKQNEAATFDKNSYEYLKAQDLVDRQ